ncbi:MAG: anion permease [Oscillospiraceae bacterium]|nr:anion permease [Oscillospiraceae bacterium]
MATKVSNPGGKSDNSFKKRILGFILAAVIIAFFTICPPFEGLSEEAMASIGIFIGAIILFVLQVAPLAISCLTLMMLLPYFKITDLPTIYNQFGGTSFFFVLFCFGVTGALSQTTMPLRISAAITKVSKGNPKVIVYGFNFAACIISGFLSNFGTLIMFYGIILMFLTLSGRKPGESGLGRCLMIGLPMACGTGGFISPAGSPGNLIAQSLLGAEGINITFLNWFLMCTPFALLAVFFMSFMLIRLFKPEPLPQEAADAVKDKRDELGPWDRKEKLAMIIIGVTIILWFVSTWVPILNTTVIAGLACFLMFMPGIDLMNWKTLVKEADWNLLFMVGSVAITMGCVNSTGAMGWIMNKLFSGVGALSPFVLFLIIGVVVCYLRVLIPTAPSVSAIFVPVMIGIAAVAGGHTTALSLIPVFWSGATMTLLYTEPIYLYTHGSGYYSAGDLFKAGLLPTILLIVIMAAVFPGWVGLFGY